jgi:hypothetical protein
VRNPSATRTLQLAVVLVFLLAACGGPKEPPRIVDDTPPVACEQLGEYKTKPGDPRDIDGDGVACEGVPSPEPESEPESGPPAYQPREPQQSPGANP